MAKLFSSKQLIVEHTTQKRIYGTVNSKPVVTRTVVAEFTSRSIALQNDTYCAPCMMTWCKKNEKSVLMRIRGGNISPDMILDEIRCVGCGDHVHPQAWTLLVSTMPDRTNPRYIWVRYKSTGYGDLDREGWWAYSFIEINPQERKSDLWGDDWLLEWCDAWCEL